MALIKIDVFKGTAPKMSARLLPEGSATTAINCRLDSGDLAPIRALGLATGSSEVGGTQNSLYKYDTVDGVVQWLRWDEDVDSTDEMKPRVTQNTVAIGAGTVFPSFSFLLGLPAPSAAPAASAVGDTPAESSSEIKETRSYVYTFVTANGEEGPPSSPSPVFDIYPTSQTATVSLMQTAEDAAYIFTAQLPQQPELSISLLLRFCCRKALTQTLFPPYRWVVSCRLLDGLHPQLE